MHLSVRSGLGSTRPSAPASTCARRARCSRRCVRPTSRPRAAADLLTQRSPLSVAATVEAMRRAAGMDSVHEVLAQDMVLARGLIEHGDFVEGVRAQLVDKDRQPMWSQASFDEVSGADVARLFEG
ncbi:enoyl-CoA hydratase/isomerase family protein [Dermacoccus sp. BD5]|uniref:enoyl-CoA hydratase/isomerase family protein n=1 Tax=Dermacoccus sp. BD5 TaxID=2953656 RepID=UPI00383C6C2C